MKRGFAYAKPEESCSSWDGIVTKIILCGVLQKQSRRTCAFSQDLSKQKFSFILSWDEKNLFVVMITESTI